jgi:hypothetical protein
MAALMPLPIAMPVMFFRRWRSDLVENADFGFG